SASRTTMRASSRPRSTSVRPKASRISISLGWLFSAIEGLLSHRFSQATVAFFRSSIRLGQLPEDLVGGCRVRGLGMPLVIELGHFDAAPFDRVGYDDYGRSVRRNPMGPMEGVYHGRDIVA